jgi:hypothetical protein
MKSCYSNFVIDERLVCNEIFHPGEEDSLNNKDTYLVIVKSENVREENR